MGRKVGTLRSRVEEILAPLEASALRGSSTSLLVVSYHHPWHPEPLDPSTAREPGSGGIK